MLFFPILQVLDCRGWVTLSNFLPNNWEGSPPPARLINVLWTNGEIWRTACLGKISGNAFYTVFYKDVRELLTGEAISDETSFFLFLSEQDVNSSLPELPCDDRWQTQIPAWRATIGLSTHVSQTSYQGEIPYPSQGTGSLVSFAPLLQFNNVQNYLILINLERSPIIRSTLLEIYRSNGSKAIASQKIWNNCINTISLNGMGFTPSDLPVFVCRDLSAIPLLFSYSSDKKNLSLEHTHPPASLVIHGSRWELHRKLKQDWLARLQPLGLKP